MLGAISDDSGGELTVIERVMEGKGETPLPHVAGGIVDVVHLNNAGEVFDQSLDQGDVLGGEELLLTAVGQLGAVLAGHDSIQTVDRVALGLVELGELLHVLLHQILVLVRGACDGNGGSAGLLIDLPALCQILEVVGIGDAVKVAVLLPLIIHVLLTLVLGGFDESIVHLEQQSPVQHRVDQDHHQGHYRDDGEDAAQNAIDQVFSHSRLSLPLSAPAGGWRETIPL